MSATEKELSPELLNEELKRYGIDPETVDASAYELDRLKRDAKLFYIRGWQKYILFLADVLNTFGIPNKNYSFSKSAIDSFLLEKMVLPKARFEPSLKKRKEESILNYDALRLDIWARRFPFNDDDIGDYGCIDNACTLIEEKLKEHDLFFKSEYLNDLFDMLVIVSDSEIPDSDVEIIKNEKRESTDEEAEVLRKYLIIKIEEREWL